MRTVLWLAGVNLGGVGPEVLVDLALIVTPLIVIELLRRLGAGSIWSDLGEALLTTRVPYRPYLTRLVGARMAALKEDVSSLSKKDGLIPDLIGLSRWLDDFFSLGGETYKGIDSHVPSDYIIRYKWFLDVHAKKARSYPRSTGDVRVIVATKTALTNDYELDNSVGYLRFIRWHQDRKIQLKWIEPRRLGEIISEIPNLESLVTNDVALWENFAVMFAAEESNDEFDEPQTTLHMRFPEDTPSRPLQPSYESLEQYVDAVVAASVVFPNGPPGLDVVDEVIAERWSDYVDTTERLRHDGPFATFLLEAIGGSEWILDTAAGIGCESILLQELGRGVVSNEVDANLSAQANILAEQRRVKLDLRPHSWLELPNALAGGGRFDAMICLGNSLCLVRNVRQQAQILKGFASRLKVGGRLVIDERNFRFLVEHADQIVENPAAAFPYLYGDPMYRGTAVRGVPVSISSSKIEWRLFDNHPERRTLEEIKNVYLDDSPLILRPFSFGELHSMLLAAGFRVIAVYADLKRVSDGELPNYEDVEDAAFFSYVAQLV